MATASAYGFSGFDPFGTVGEGIITGGISNFWNKKSTKHSAQKQADYAAGMMRLQSQINRQNQQWSAENLPHFSIAATKSALKENNINPLLAYGDFSGFSGSGAMGVTPSNFAAGPTPDIEYGSGSSGFDEAEFDRQLGSGRKARQNAKKVQSIKSQDLDTESDIADIRREKAPITSAMEYDKKQAELSEQESSARLQEAKNELTAFLLARETEAVTGRAQPDRTSGHSRGTDEQNEFWNDFYRNKQDLQKYQNSAYRAYMLDALGAGKDITDMVDVFKPKPRRRH